MLWQLAAATLLAAMLMLILPGNRLLLDEQPVSADLHR
jgi:hypothetical protein